MLVVSSLRSLILQGERQLVDHRAGGTILHRLRLHASEIINSDHNHISKAEILNFLRNQAIPYRKGPTCVSAVCPGHNVKKSNSQQSNKDLRLYINSTTGKRCLTTIAIISVTSIPTRYLFGYYPSATPNYHHSCAAFRVSVTSVVACGGFMLAYTSVKYCQYRECSLQGISCAKAAGNRDLGLY